MIKIKFSLWTSLAYMRTFITNLYEIRLAYFSSIFRVVFDLYIIAYPHDEWNNNPIQIPQLLLILILTTLTYLCLNHEDQFFF